MSGKIEASTFSQEGSPVSQVVEDSTVLQNNQDQIALPSSNLHEYKSPGKRCNILPMVLDNLSAEKEMAVGPMLQRHKQILQKYRTVLIADLDACDIMDQLVQEGIFNLNMRECILSQTTRQDRMRALIDLLVRRGASAFQAFLNSLKSDFQHLHLMLKEAEKKVSKSLDDTQEHTSDIYIYGHEIRKYALSQNSGKFHKLIDDNDVDSGVDVAKYWDPYELGIDKSKAFHYETPMAAPSVLVNKAQECNFTAVINKDVKARIINMTSNMNKVSNVVSLPDHQGKSKDKTPKQSSTWMKLYHNIGTFISSVCLILSKSIQYSYHKLLAFINYVMTFLVKTKEGISPERIDSDKGISTKEESSKKETIDENENLELVNQVAQNTNEEEFLQLKKGDLVILESQCNETGVATVFNIEGQHLKLPNEHISLYGDPKGELWFYPAEISSRQATLLLSGQPEGCFLVYRSLNSAADVVFNLSICTGCGHVFHYPIYESESKEVGLKNGKAFLCIHDLVIYHRQNRAELCCRLRKSPAEMKQAVGLEQEIPHHLLVDSNELKYDSDSEIGKGSYAKVLRGIYQNQPVAVKIPIGAEDRSIERELLEEANIIMSISHKNIIKFIAMSPKYPLCLVIEYAEQGDLRHWLRENETIEPETLTKICLQVLSALRYLKNQRYIIHRDISARNCLVNYDGDMKLADFGMSRRVVDDVYKAESREKVAVRWASPEVLSELMYSSYSDIWAAGVLIWEIYSKAKVPYAGKSSREVVQYVMGGDRLSRPEACPPEVFKQVKQCWNTTPKRRPSAAGLYDGLVACSYYSTGFTAMASSTVEDDSETFKLGTPSPMLPSPRSLTLKDDSLKSSNETVKCYGPAALSKVTQKRYYKLPSMFKRKKKQTNKPSNT